MGFTKYIAVDCDVVVLHLRGGIVLATKATSTGAGCEGQWCWLLCPFLRGFTLIQVLLQFLLLL